ncbi:hypothetical protein [Acetobacter sp.]|uniref:hypothetical protein n=1 Tax=Acetobacter sp. TaxID=440 RepID=UPI00258BCAE7|nr:hypothetical protein [Acetobacter sp.]MCC6104828.1 hypothetical protein [Acetobacter sp.]
MTRLSILGGCLFLLANGGGAAWAQKPPLASAPQQEAPAPQVVVPDAGTWDVKQSDSKDGGAFCQLEGTFSDGRKLALLTGQRTYPHHTLMVEETSWPDMTGENIKLIFQSAKADKWQQSYNMFGANDTLSTTLDIDDLRILFTGLTHSGWLVIGFPTGDEDTWVLNMLGFMEKAKDFRTCVSRVTEIEGAI